MWKNYLKVAGRNLWKNPLYSLINIGGLAISLSIALMMILWVQDERKYNQFHENIDRISHLYMGFFDANNNIDPHDRVSYLLTKTALEEIPELEAMAVFSHEFEVNLTSDKKEFSAKGIAANDDLFDVFSFPIIAGSVVNATENLNSVILSENLAQKIFGKYWQEKAIGANLQWNKEEQVTVEAVMADISIHSTIQFDLVSNLQKRKGELIYWGNHSFSAYPLIQEDADLEEVEKKISEIYINSEAYDEGEFVIAQPLEKEYLYTRFDNAGNAIGGRIEYVRIFFFASIFLLFIAAINFVNMSTARASTRAKEVAVRKTTGAKRSELIAQFMVEATLVASISIACSILISELLLPFVRDWSDKSLHFSYAEPVFWLSGLGLVGTTALFAGSYPAFVLSSFKIQSMFGKEENALQSPINLRQGLVVLQFVFAMLLMTGAITVQQQTNYIKTKNLGLDRENVLHIDMNDKVKEKVAVLKTELQDQPGIATITSTTENPLNIEWQTNGVDWEGKAEDQWHIHFNILMTETNFLDAFKVPLKSGRFFDAEKRTDSAAVVLNEAAIAVMGLDIPVEGQKVNFWGEDRQVIGVVEDFHTTSFYKEIPPMLLLLGGDNSALFIRTKTGETETAIASLQTAFKNVVPSETLAYEFLDESYAQQYKSEQLTSKLAKYFAWFSIFISCLGLFGLATFIASSKTREIGIRKVLGASVAHITFLLSRNFLKIILIALFIAVPIAWYFSNSWLSQFAYRINVQWWMFAIAGFTISAIALATISIQSIRAALASPLENLRNE